MKISNCHHLSTAIAGAVLIGVVLPQLNAQEAVEKPDPAEPADPVATQLVSSPSFEELSEKLNIDAMPIAQLGAPFASYADTLEQVMPAVVTIYSTKEVASPSRSRMFDDPLFRRFFGVPENEEDLEVPPLTQQGLGSGVIISADGYILTNNHVVEDADEIMVSLATDQRDYKATVIGADPRTDVALIKIKASGLKMATIGDSSTLRVGDVALAIGNPFGLEQTVTSGIVSGLGRNSLDITGGGYENFIQTDASINQGNSGGALVDASGRLIGINTAIQAGAGGSIGIGFAIPSNMALNIVQRLLDGGGNVRRGFLGVRMNPLDSRTAEAMGRQDKAGVMIVEVVQDTPAASAGLKAGDLIVAYNDQPVESMQRLRLDISNTLPGEKVSFQVIRKDEEVSFDVVLGDLENMSTAFIQPPLPVGPDPEEVAKEMFIDGVVVVELDEVARAALGVDETIEGVVVESVDVNCAAAKAGLQVGQIITEVDQEKVTTVEEAFAVRKVFKGDLLYLQVDNEGQKSILVISVK